MSREAVLQFKKYVVSSVDDACQAFSGLPLVRGGLSPNEKMEILGIYQDCLADLNDKLTAFKEDLTKETEGELKTLRVRFTGLHLGDLPSVGDLNRALAGAGDGLCITKIWEERTYINGISATMYFVEASSCEHALQMVHMDTLELSSGVTAEFTHTVTDQERRTWMVICSEERRLNDVQAEIADMGAVETNRQYLFQCELSPKHVVEASPAYVDQLKELKGKVGSNDMVGIDTSILGKRPIKDISIDDEKVAELSRQRILLITSLREYQARGYRFEFSTEI